MSLTSRNVRPTGTRLHYLGIELRQQAAAGVAVEALYRWAVAKHLLGQLADPTPTNMSNAVSQLLREFGAFSDWQNAQRRRHMGQMIENFRQLARAGESLVHLYTFATQNGLMHRVGGLHSGVIDEAVRNLLAEHGMLDTWFAANGERRREQLPGAPWPVPPILLPQPSAPMPGYQRQQPGPVLAPSSSSNYAQGSHRMYNFQAPLQPGFRPIPQQNPGHHIRIGSGTSYPTVYHLAHNLPTLTDLLYPRTPSLPAYPPSPAPPGYTSSGMSNIHPSGYNSLPSHNSMSGPPPTYSHPQRHQPVPSARFPIVPPAHDRPFSNLPPYPYQPTIPQPPRFQQLPTAGQVLSTQQHQTGLNNQASSGWRPNPAASTFIHGSSSHGAMRQAEQEGEAGDGEEEE